MPRVALVTKTKTQNQGNQALSIAWRDFLSRRYPNASVRLVERSPDYLKRFRVDALEQSTDAVLRFDEIAASLVRQAKRVAEADKSTWEVVHAPQMRQVVRFRSFRRLLRLKSRLSSLGIGSSDYLGRLAYLVGSSMVVMNPAGEFQSNAGDTALAYLLEARCAQLTGVRTAFVNLSFEITNPTLMRVADHVFQHCDVLEFRDEESAQHLRSHGGLSTPVVLPDAAILTEVPREINADGRRGIALAINALQLSDGYLQDAWDSIIPQLTGLCRVTLTSNEWTTDEPLWRRSRERFGLEAEGGELSAADYARFLASFGVVVSSRLHTCVLGLVAGVPIVPVETGTFKLSGFFRQIGMEHAPVRVGANDWGTDVVVRAAEALDRREEWVALQDKHLVDARAALVGGLDRLFVDELLG